MPITLLDFANGDTNYVAKHNTNNAALKTMLDSIESTINTMGMSSASPANSANIGKATYGTSGMILVGTSSFAYTLNETTDVMQLAAGFCWDSAAGLMIYKASTTNISFLGMAAGTYYIRFDGAGNPYRDTVDSKSIYRVVWAGTTFTSVTLLATFAPGGVDLQSLLTSTYSGLSYLTPGARVDATEAAFSAFFTANVASGNVTLTTAQAMENGVIKLTGTMAANRQLIVPAKKKVYTIHNSTAGAFTCTVKTSSGTGVALNAAEHALLYCDGTNVLSVIVGSGGGGGASTFTGLSDTPSAYTGQANKIVKVKADETGLEFDSATAPSVFTGLTDTPASYSGEAGKFVKVNIAETGLEFSATAADFLSLSDTPSSYSGNALKVVSVNATGDGLEFSTNATPTSFVGLTDTPASYSSFGGYTVKVKADGTGLEFVQGGTGTFLGLTDTPTDFTGAALKYLRVNAAGDAVEFTEVSLGSFTSLTDTPADFTGGAYKVLTVKGDESGIEFSDAATPTSFVGLTDTPADYSGAASKTVKVNSAGTGLEFVTVPAGTTTFTGLTDTPSNFTGHAKKQLRVKAAEDGVEFVAEPAVVCVAWNGAPTADQVLQMFVAPFAIDFAAAMAGSYGIALTAATAQTDISVKKIAAGSLTETSVGTVRFAATASAPTFIAASAFSLAAGDALKFTAPATPDATLANFSFSVVGTR